MTEKPKRKASFMEVNSNPFEQKDKGAKVSGLEAPTEFESLADTVKIERIDFDNIVSALESEDSNDLRIKTLHIMKTPYLFTSEQLITILHITPSVKTRITFIEEIGPRLTDPKAKSQQIIDMFRYSDEKRQVEEVLKARAQTVSKQSSFSRGKSQSVLNTGGGGRGGRGGGGRGGRGGGGRGLSKSTSVDALGSGSSSSGGGAGRGGGGRGAGRGGAGRGAGAAGRGGRGGASSTPTVISPPSVAPPSPTITPSITSTPIVPETDSKEESKGEELTEKPAWTPPLARKSFTSPELSEIMLPRKSLTEVTPIAMNKRFSSHGMIRPSNSLGTVEDAPNESDEDEDNDVAEKKTEATSVSDERDGKRSPSPVKTAPLARRTKPERRESSFCATGSVMAALGFDDLSVLTTDDIGRESWDIKADGEASKNVPTKEVAEKLKDIAVTTRTKEDLATTHVPAVDSVNSTPTKDKANDENEDQAPSGMRTEDEFKNDPMVSQVKPNRVSLQQLQERRRVLKVKKMWENDKNKSSKAPVVEFTPLRVTSRRKSTRLIAEEERMAQYATSKEEGPIGVNEATGKNYYSYHELVRRNYVKSFGDVVQTELEEYLTDGEFFVRFNMSKDEFAALPRWRRVERKRALMLF